MIPVLTMMPSLRGRQKRDNGYKMGEQTVRQPNAGSIEQTHQHSPTRTHRLASCSWQPSVKVRPVLFQTAARRLGAKSDSAAPLPLFRTRSYLCWLCTDPAGSVPTLAAAAAAAHPKQHVQLRPVPKISSLEAMTRQTLRRCSRNVARCRLERTPRGSLQPASLDNSSF